MLGSSTFCFERDFDRIDTLFPIPSYGFSEEEPNADFLNDNDEPEDSAEELPFRQGISPNRMFMNTPSRHHHRPHERQEMTLRSYRDPRSVAGRAAARKLARRIGG